MLTQTKKRWAINNSILQEKIHLFRPTKSQKSVLESLKIWFAGWSGNQVQKEPAILQGKAGTGKSTLVSQLILMLIAEQNYMFQDQFSVALIAPTNRAKEVLRAFSQKSELWKFCKVSVFTTHSLGGMIADGLDSEGYLNDLWGTKKESKYDLVIVDEYSMIDEIKLYPNLLPLFSKYPFLFLGDLNQLPPVIDKRFKSKIKPGESIVNLNHPNFCFDISEVVRYSGSILDFSYEILDQYQLDTQVVSLPSKRSQDGQIELINTERFEEILVTKIGHFDLLNQDILDFKVLCYTNDRVNFWNKKIRRSLFPGLSDYSQILDRDHLIVKEPVYRVDSEGNNRLAFYTNEFFIPDGVENNLSLVFEDKKTGLYLSDLNFQRIYARNNYGQVDFLFPSPESLSKLSQYGVFRMTQIKNIEYSRDRKREYNDLISLLRSFGVAYKNDPTQKSPFKRQVIPFYAATIHSCQGTTLKQAVIDWDDLHKARNTDFKNMTGDIRKRLAYVACTRATDKITIVSDSIDISESIDTSENYDDNPF